MPKCLSHPFTVLPAHPLVATLQIALPNRVKPFFSTQSCSYQKNQVKSVSSENAGLFAQKSLGISGRRKQSIKPITVPSK